jgi:hypothetical protein
MELDENLKQLMKQLGVAINEALTDSESIGEAITHIREAGYDVFLVLEATIGFHNREQEDKRQQKTAPGRSGDLVLTVQDNQFLKSLKISISGSEDLRIY